MRNHAEQKHVLPGFRPALACTVFYLSLIVMIPVAVLFLKTATLTWSEFWQAVAAPRTLASFRLSFGLAFMAAGVNAVLGLVVAWVLARYRFPGRAVMDMLVDLPFALPTAVAGIALTAAFAQNGVFGAVLTRLGIRVAFTPLGILVALVFIGVPFVIRSVQPVLEELDRDMEEAAACLGAGHLKTFLYVVFPEILPALLSGFAMAFARAVGEYGSVVFISGNMPFKTEIAPLLIMTKLEQYDVAGASTVAVVMLLLSFAALFAINVVQGRTHHGKG